jgi:hypothetical protein
MHGREKMVLRGYKYLVAGEFYWRTAFFDEAEPNPRQRLELRWGPLHGFDKEPVLWPEVRPTSGWPHPLDKRYAA